MPENKFSAPAPDEVELSIFGPGVGECILLHLGDSEWLIVDSCVHWESQNPAPLEYLKKIGVDVCTAVKCFVASHWHDDHIRGASQIVKECPNARFVCSSALRSDEFFTLVNLQKSALNSGVEEFGNILEEIKRRFMGKNAETAGPTWASAERRLLLLPRGNRRIHAEVFALSPSDAAFTLALQELGQLIPAPNSSKRRVISQQPNHVSVALWVMIENLYILLGSDLENRPDENLGWKAVIFSPNRPSGKAVLVKVPHHGSSNSYSEEMWCEMATPNAIALLTPFSKGRNPLPNERGIKNIQKHTNRIYITGEVHRGHPPKMDPAVNRTIREMLRTRRVVHGPMGHVRVRCSVLRSTLEPKIELFNGAKQI